MIINNHHLLCAWHFSVGEAYVLEIELEIELETPLVQAKQPFYCRCTEEHREADFFKVMC